MKKLELHTQGASHCPSLGAEMNELKPEGQSAQQPVELMSTDLKGQQLLDTVAELSGVDSPLFRSGLQEILDADGCDPKQLTLDAFRESLLKYLDEIHETMTETLSPEELGEDLDQTTH